MFGHLWLSLGSRLNAEYLVECAYQREWTGRLNTHHLVINDTWCWFSSHGRVCEWNWAYLSRLVMSSSFSLRKYDIAYCLARSNSSEWPELLPFGKKTEKSQISIKRINSNNPEEIWNAWNTYLNCLHGFHSFESANDGKSINSVRTRRQIKQSFLWSSGCEDNINFFNINGCCSRCSIICAKHRCSCWSSNRKRAARYTDDFVNASTLMKGISLHFISTTGRWRSSTNTPDDQRPIWWKNSEQLSVEKRSLNSIIFRLNMPLRSQ